MYFKVKFHCMFRSLPYKWCTISNSKPFNEKKAHDLCTISGRKNGNINYFLQFFTRETKTHDNKGQTNKHRKRRNSKTTHRLKEIKKERGKTSNTKCEQYFKRCVLNTKRVQPIG